MIQDPNTPKYNSTSGLLTDYGKYLGLKEVNTPTTVPFSSINTAPMTTPQIPPSTSGAGNNAFIESNNASVMSQQEADLKAQADNQGEVGSEIVKLMEGLGQTGAMKEDAYSSAGVDKAKKTVDDLTSQIEAEQLSSRRQVESARKNFTGTTSGLNQELGRIQRESFSKQADMAIVQSAALRRYDTASAIAERQLQSKLEPMKARLDALKFIYQENKEAFNKADDRLYSEKIKEEDRKFKKIEETENDIKNVKLTAAQNGADISTLAKIGEATDFDEALQAAGSSLATSQNDIVKLDNGTTMLVDKRTGKVIKNFGGAKPAEGTYTGIPQSIVRTVAGKPVSGYTLVAGDDPYNIAQANGTDMAGLKAVNPNITDWTTLQPGQTINLPSITDGWLTGKTEKQVQVFNSLPDADKESVKQLVNGDALIADLVKSRGIQGTAQIQKLINEATAVDPSFSVNTNKVRYEFQKQFTTDNLKGAVGSQNAINTALGHLADLSTLSKELPQGTLGKLNSVENILSKETGDPAITNFRINLNALGAELARVYKGGVPNEGEIKEWQENLAASFSQSQFTGAFDTTAKLLSSKITAVRYQYSKAMGREYPQTLIDPDKLQALIDAGIDPNSIAQEKTGSGKTSTPKSLQTYYGNPKYKTQIEQAIAQFPQYSESEILQVLGLEQ